MTNVALARRSLRTQLCLVAWAWPVVGCAWGGADAPEGPAGKRVELNGAVGRANPDAATGAATADAASGGGSDSRAEGGHLGGAGGGSSEGTADLDSGVAGGPSGGNGRLNDLGPGRPDGGPIAPGEPLVHCEELYALQGLPTIDGLVEPGMHLEFMDPVGVFGEPPPPGTFMRFAVGWHPTGVYFYAEVTDPDRHPANVAMPVWQGDSVEFFVDHDAVFAPPGAYDSVGTKQLIVAAPGTAFESGRRADVYIASGYQSHWQDTQWLSVPIVGGYIVEAFVVAGDLGLAEMTLVAGGKIGIDLAHDVSLPPGQTGPATTGNRLGQYFYKVAEPFGGGLYDYPFGNTSVFCRPTLLAPSIEPRRL